MKFDPEAIRRSAEKNFEKTWNLGREMTPILALNQTYPRFAFGYRKTHPIFETMNPVIVEDRDVHRRFGPEALTVLDRCFYLAGLPRPDVGLSDERIARIREIIGREMDENDVEMIKQVLHSYKRGEIEGDDLIHELSERLDTTDPKVAVVM